jgi:DNA-binding transcriptional regulator YhcF (GntR family)
VDDGILYKKRGIGMFVAEGAQARIVTKRRDHFSEEYVRPLVQEAAKLGISSAELAAMVQGAAALQGDSTVEATA